MDTPDTIVALVTPWVSSGVAIIRVSGPRVPEYITQWLGRRTPRPRFFYKSPFTVRHHVIDEGLWVYFKAPHSYTGEDILELYPHGSLVVVQHIINELVHMGCRLAREGEFTQRAFMAGKMDLTQAEAVRELVDSVSWQGALAACQSLRGAVSERCYALEARLSDLRAQAEGYLDFSDSDMDPEDFLDTHNALHAWLKDARLFCQQATQSARSSQKITVAILGLPNAGKSSLMNTLTHTDTSIVSDIAGTTRDIVRQDVVWGSQRVHLLDTAGIRETDCAIEKSGIERIEKNLSHTQLILWVIDASEDAYEDALESASIWLSRIPLAIPVIFVLNKSDKIRRHTEEKWGERPVVSVSCYTREGIDNMISVSLSVLGSGISSAPFYASFRQVKAIEDAISCVEKALVYKNIDECYAHELLQAHRCCMQILGFYNTEDLLGNIFSHFCIGK